MTGPVHKALIFSDVHLGWVVCGRHHVEWLRRLPEAVDDAELVVLNGDIVDMHRRVHRAAEGSLVEELGALVSTWRRQGRTVVCIEGNHDAQPHSSRPLRPDRWYHDFETQHGARVRVLHGHRFSPSATVWKAYDRAGRGMLALENFVYGRMPVLPWLYRYGPGWLVAGIGSVECFLARRQLPGRLSPLLDGIDAVVHGHVHYGPGHGRVGDIPTWRSGSWVSPGHLGTADRMLRYRAGRFERIGWARNRWRAFDDGR